MQEDGKLNRQAIDETRVDEFGVGDRGLGQDLGYADNSIAP